MLERHRGLERLASSRGRLRSGTMQVRAILLAAALALVPLSARAADLVVWWEEGFNPEEDQAVREMVAAFEQKTGRQVELVFSPPEELPTKILGALEAGHPPDFLYTLGFNDR